MCHSENVHVELYTHLLRELDPGNINMDDVSNGELSLPNTVQKTEWCSKYFDRDQYSFGTRLIAHAVVEGLFSCSTLATVLSFETLGLLPGLCRAAHLILRDKQLFVDFACQLYGVLSEEVPVCIVSAIVTEAVSLEKACFAGKHAITTYPESALSVGRSRA